MVVGWGMMGLQAAKVFGILALLGLMVLPPAQAAREPLLPLGRGGAKSSALGGTGAFLPGSADSIFFNPAALSQVAWPELSLGFGGEDLGETTQISFAGAVPVAGRLVMGAGGILLKFPHDPQQELNTYILSLAFPLSLNGRLLAGINGKLLQDRIPGAPEAGMGVGADLGFIYQALINPEGLGLSLGLGVVDAQTVLRREENEIRLPTVFRAGGSASFFEKTLALLVFENQSSSVPEYDSFQIIRLGIETRMTLNPGLTAAFRLGYLQRLDQAGIMTAGLGAEYSDWRLDYAVQLPAAMKFASHQMSLSWGYQSGLKSKLHAPETTPAAAAATPAPTEQAGTKIFSALESAAQVSEKIQLFAPTPIPVSSLETGKQPAKKEPEPESREYAYRLPVPESPADQARADIAPDLEMPGSFSGYLSGIRSGTETIRIVNQELRLHVVVNPFSPNHDGIKDRTIILGRVESESLKIDHWSLYIIQADKVFRTFKGGSNLPRNLEWDGTDERGKVLPDGNYDVLLRVFDHHGMEAASATQPVRIITKSESVKLTAPALVTITGDKQDKPVTIDIPKTPRSSDWQFLISDPSGRKVWQRNGSGEVPDVMNWIPAVGKKSVPAGRYRARLAYRDEAGLKATAEVTFKISFAEFSVNLKAAPQIFQTKGNNGAGVTFQPEIQGDLKIARWILKITGESSEAPVRVIAGEGSPPAGIVWDGQNESGKDVPGGKAFRGYFTAYSAVGSEETAESSSVQSDLGAYAGTQALSINLVHVNFAASEVALDEKSRQALTSAIEVIKQYKTDYALRVLGYTDQTEAQGKEMELSRNRAQTVADYLVQTGQIPLEKIQTMGYAADKPLSKENTPDGEAKNRRVEVVLFAK